MRLFGAQLVILVTLGPCAGAQPLTLRASPVKPQTLAGESIVIQIDQAVSADLDMETVELNRNRSHVAVTPLANPSARRVLSGSDYLPLHRVEGIVQLGDAFHAPAGRKWTTELNLFDYTRPLAPGRYRIEISYQYGNTEKETVRANPVEVEVLPVQVASASFRRFGFGSGEVLRGLWSAMAPNGSKHWFYQESPAFDPGVVAYAVDAGSDLGAPARLAHLNDIPGMQFANYGVWVTGSQICWLALHRGGRSGNPACADTGLASAATLADPPLQKRMGGFNAVVTGKDASGKAGASIVSVSGDGKATHKEVAMPDLAASARVGWAGDNESPMLFYAASGHIVLVDLGAKSVKQLGASDGDVELAVDQWTGNGRFWAFIKRPGSIQARSWSLDGRKENNSEEVRTGTLAGRPLVATYGPESADFALQFDRALVTRAGEKAIAQAGSLALIGSRMGLFSIEGSAAGLRVTRLGGGAQ